MEFNELTEEQKDKVKGCKTPEELIVLAKAEGVELTDDELEAVAGGTWNSGCSQERYGCGVIGH